MELKSERKEIEDTGGAVNTTIWKEKQSLNLR
jgi:hypothetical protein